MTHPEADRLNELAEKCVQEAVRLLQESFYYGNRSFMGGQRQQAAHLLDCAASLRALNHHDTKVTEEGVGE
jgi:hypothetical protein